MKTTINKFFFLFIIISGSYLGCNAKHISGGNITYQCLGNNNYKFTVKLYRDCRDATGADFDSPGNLPTNFLIFNLDNNAIYDRVPLDFPAVTNLIPSVNSCISNPPTDFCLQEGVYTFTETLPPNTNGYIIAYERCCRNNGVVNVSGSGDDGIAIFVKLTKAAMQVCNNTPVFNIAPPNYVCINSSLDINFAATDADGDVLKYSFFAPFIAGSFPNNTQPGTLGSGTPDFPPFDTVQYNNSFNAYNALGTNSPISINPNTGLISCIPNTLGLFTIGVVVKEYRAGVLLSETYRDFQFDVENCQIPSSAPVVVTDNSSGSAIKVDDSTFSNCQGAVVRFDSRVTLGAGNTYFWNFGDPSTLSDTATIKNPTYTYADTGTYYATLIINKGKPCSDTSRIKIIYYPGLTANFGYVPKCQNELIQFKDSSTSVYNDINKWKWVLSAGDTSVLQNPTKLFTASGNYNVTLTATTARGCIAKITKTVTVNPKPKAGFNANYLCFRHSAALTDASTISPGTITSYNWDFGDGFTDTLKNPTHTYNVYADSFSIRHIVSTAFGCKDTIIKKVKMDDTVKISYTTAPASLCEKSPITFTNTSTGGNPTAFQWIINNGPAANGNTAIATFPNGGIFPVKLISTNRCGNDTLKSSVVINSNPSVNLGSDVTVCNKSFKVITASGAFDSLRWNTGENTPAITIDGNKSPINVTVYKNGCAGKDTILVKKQIITPNFSNNYLCLNKPVTFNNTSTVNIGTLTQFDWKYSDGNSDINIQSPTHTFTPFGNYSVQLVATSDIGCKDTVVKTIAMDTVLNVNFNTAELISCQRKAVDFIDLTTGGVNNQNTWYIENNNFVTKNKSYVFLGTGIYPVKLVVSNRCYVDSISKNIQIRPRPNVYLGRDTILCKNQTTLFSVNPTLYDSIRWVNGSAAGTQIADGSINPFKIKVYVAGCAAEDTVNVNAPKFTLNFSNDFICFNKPILFNNTSTVTYGNIANYNWSFGDGQSANGIKSPTHTYAVFGPKNVQLIATGSAGNCMDTLRKTVLMDDSISFNVNPVPRDICYGKTVQYTNLSTGGVNTAYTWSLNNANAQTGNTATYTHTFVGANSIKLLATNRCGADSIKYDFVVLPLPKVNLGDDSIIMCPGELKTIGIHQTADSIFWSTGDRDVDSITIDGLTSPIKVDVYNNGCLAKDSIFVSTNCDIFIPTAFSPNSDGVNDLFNMMNKSIKSYTLRIYNRWGELVFETNDLNTSWNGTYKGLPCPVDSYTYIASGVRYNNEPFYLKGTLTLLR